jgi:serine/threonine protein kinase
MFAFEQPEASWLEAPFKIPQPTEITLATAALDKKNNDEATEFAYNLGIARKRAPAHFPDVAAVHSRGEDGDGGLSQSRELTGPVEQTVDVGAAGISTPPVDISATSTTPRGRHSATFDHPLKPENLSGRATRKKKRAHKHGALAAPNAARALTPATSCDEDSDFSSGEIFRKRELSSTRSLSISNSPGLRASSPGGGLSALTRQLEALNTETGTSKPSLLRFRSKLGTETPSSASVTSDGRSDEDSTNNTSYEVPLEHDFVSPDAPQDDGDGLGQGSILDNIFKKMTATDFEPLRCLGKGSYGTVILVKHGATGRLYAQKQFKKASLTVRKQLVEQTKTERAILESINRHPFVVKLYYAFQDHEKLYLILEYAQGGELFTRMLTERMFSEETASFYMAEMVLALEHLHHTVGVVYRDLKPENCLLDTEGHLLLTDFGLSKVAVDGDYRCNSMTGTVEYMAPEVIMQKHYGTAVDWWSLGILGFDLLTGSSPFHANNETKIKEKILKAKLILPYFLSADAKDLLTRFLRKEPKKRLGFCMPRDLQLIKSHRFFRKIDWKKLERRELEPPIKPLITDPELAENFSADFTDLALSPRCDRKGSIWDEGGEGGEGNPFGGFSFVASSSVLESGHGFF